MTWREETIGECRLILGDCRDVLSTLGRVDAVVTDPPYGIDVDYHMSKAGGTQYGTALAAKRSYDSLGWDDQPIPEELMDLVRSKSSWQIIFGGNYYTFPASSCWLVWDKKINGQFADCELAWTNLKRPVRRLEWMWNGMIRKGHEPRGFHPTQKPTGVMEWCIEQLPVGVETILDPFMGSGTTGVACVRLGKRFIGIEREPQYFETACERIVQATRQPNLFIEAEKQPQQASLLDEAAA